VGHKEGAEILHQIHSLKVFIRLPRLEQFLFLFPRCFWLAGFQVFKSVWYLLFGVAYVFGGFPESGQREERSLWNLVDQFGLLLLVLI